FGRSLRVFGSILAVASLAVIVFASPLAYLLGPGLSAEQHQQTEMLFRLLAPSVWFAGMAAVFSALLYTKRRFLIPGLYQVSLNGTTILMALVLWKALGIYGFAIGYSAGACLQLAI